MKKRGRRVADGDQGAFEPVGPKLDRRRAAGIADLARAIRHAFIVQRDDDLVPGGQVTPDDPRADHLAIAQHRGASGQCRLPRRESALGIGQTIRHLDHAAGVDNPRGELRDAGIEAIQPRLFLDRREALPIDRGRITLVTQGRSHFERADSGPCGCLAWGYSA